MKQARFELNRLAALSDGVFAIALTLLVLDLKLPTRDAMSTDVAVGLSFDEALLGQIPHALSWILSFAILVRLWVVQHALLVGGGQRTRSFMGWNFVFLGAVSVVPFTASLIAERHEHALSVIVFSLVLCIGGIALDRMWNVEHDYFVKQAESDAAVSTPRPSVILILLTAIIASGVALVHPTAGPFVWIAYPLSAPLSHRLFGNK